MNASPNASARTLLAAAIGRRLPLCATGHNADLFAGLSHSAHFAQPRLRSLFGVAENTCLWSNRFEELRGRLQRGFWNARVRRCIVL